MIAIDRERWTTVQCRRWLDSLTYRVGDQDHWSSVPHPDRQRMIAESVEMLSWGQLASVFAYVRDVVPLRTASDIHYALRSANNERPEQWES